MILLKYGISAATSTAGAGTFKEEWVNDFKDIERIYLCLDNDAAGQAGTKRLIELFTKCLPESALYTITFPERMISGKDISDYFNDFQGTAEELLGSCAKLVKNKELTTKKDIQPISIAQLMSTKFPDNIWLIDSLLPQQGITALSGQPVSCKTWIVLHIAIQVARGEMVFNKFNTVQGGVLIIDEENGPALLQTRIKKLQSSSFDLPIYFLMFTGFKLEQKSVEKLQEFIELNNIKLIIIDSLVRIHSKDENDAGQMSGVFALIRQLTNFGVSVLFTHHHRKSQFGNRTSGQEMRGSSDILASVDCHLASEKRDGSLYITQTKSRWELEIGTFEVGVEDKDELVYLEYLGALDQAKNKKQLAREAIIELLEESAEPMFKQQIFNKIHGEGINIGQSTFKSVMGALEKEGLIGSKRAPGNKMMYSTINLEKSIDDNLLSQNTPSI